MKIIDILNSKSAVLSFEVFPPKTDTAYVSVAAAVKKIAAISPDFMSVTYGAGGGGGDYTVEVCEKVAEYGVTPIAHLTCVGAGKADVIEKLRKLRALGIENVLALRGDMPEGFHGQGDFRYACELVSETRAFGGFCVGGACYPEGHPESATLFSDIENLKRKVDAGCDFLTTQMFFDNDVFYSFLSKIRDKGIYAPVIAGVMPVTNAKQIKRMLSISGGWLPTRFRRIIDRFGNDNDAMTQAGIAYATEQIIDLYANGIKAVHVYSMNKPEVAAAIKSNLSDII